MTSAPLLPSDVAANVAAVKARLADAARRAGRDPGEVCLVAVSKTVDVDRIRAAVAAGVPALGENRVQEAREKVGILGRPVPWHLIGHLQTNKVKDALQTFDLIESLDRAELGEALARRAEADGRMVDVLIQVNVGEEPQKGGFVPAELRPALERLLGQPRLRLRGLMAIAPLPQDPEDSRPYYRELRKLFEAARDWGVGSEWRELSMGMSGDFEVGIEEGATIVRVGTAVFGARKAAP